MNAVLYTLSTLNRFDVTELDKRFIGEIVMELERLEKLERAASDLYNTIADSSGSIPNENHEVMVAVREALESKVRYS